jgi:starch phosphorylase
MADLASPTIRTFQVFPDLPDALKPLNELAHNIWWMWHPDAVELFHRLDRTLWNEVYHNPVKLLGAIQQEKLAAAALDEGFLAHLSRVYMMFKSHLSEKGWFNKAHAEESKLLVAYFSAEFGLHESLPIYSGGLGILAGDHLKSASEIGLPLIGVGLLYRQGYFQQYLSADGWQQ